MWISRADHEALIESRTRAAVLTEQIITFRTQTAFLIARINQLEKERAIMLRHITKLEIPVPELTAVAAPPLGQRDILAAMGSSMFDDMGDAAAKREGVSWDHSGAVQYAPAIDTATADEKARYG
jgi:hypothetical protein